MDEINIFISDQFNSETELFKRDRILRVYRDKLHV